MSCHHDIEGGGSIGPGGCADQTTSNETGPPAWTVGGPISVFATDRLGSRMVLLTRGVVARMALLLLFVALA